MKYHTGFFISIVLCSSLGDTDDPSLKIQNSKSTNRLLHDLLVTLLTKCNINSKKIIAYDHTQMIFNAIIESYPQVTALLFSNLIASIQYMDKYRIDDLDFSVVILAIRLTDKWEYLYNNFIRWRFNRNCTVYMVVYPLNDCKIFQHSLEWMMRYNFRIGYFICFTPNRNFIIYSHDPYGDTKPPYWIKIFTVGLWKENWTFYKRVIDADNQETNDICPGFHFNRTDPSSQVMVPVGIRKDQIEDYFVKGKGIYGAEVEKNFKQPHKERVYMLKKLLNLQFKYFVIQHAARGYRTSFIDATICTQTVVKLKIGINYFFPTEYEYYAIMSHDRGAMTPLEKIAKFYGVWTLSSLIVITSMTFGVIWFITKKINCAFFNVMRLVINTGIMVPIDTLSRKIFFCMIFLYFLIIHATFSGHLAEFLTKPDKRANIESIEELTDPRIKNIYNFGYEYDETDESDLLQQKTMYLRESNKFRKSKNKSGDVYIAPAVVLYMNWPALETENNSLYISKNTFGMSLISSSYRPGFPLREKFNWAYIYLFERGIAARGSKEHSQNVTTAIAKQKAKADIHHRPITLLDIDFAFFLLMIGNSIAFICFIFEISLNIIRKKLRYSHRKHNGLILRVDTSFD